MKKIIRKGSFYSVSSDYNYELKEQENYEYTLKKLHYKYDCGCNRISL